MQQDLSAPPAPAATHRRRLFSILGGLGILLTILLIAAIVIPLFLHSQSEGSGPQRVTTGPHITRIQTGTGFDQKKARVLGETSNFSTGQVVYVVFTVVNKDPHAQVVLHLFQGTTRKLTSAPLNPEVGTNVYASYALLHHTGQYRWEADYNGVAEASITFSLSA